MLLTLTSDLLGTIGPDLYLGLSAGMQWGDVPISFDNDYNMNSDIAFGGFVGVNHQYDDFVVGAELALQTGTDTDGDDSSEDYDVNYTADAKLKLGMALGSEDQLLIYGFGGFSAIRNHDWNTRGSDYSTFGVNYGVGAEYMVTEQFSLGAELMGRSPIDEYGWDDHDHNAGLSYQATLRAAFHF